MLAANDVASVILARSGPWTDAMRLQKLLYYVQAWHLAVTDQPLFAEQFKAWKDGPVVPQVWHDRKDRSSRRAVAQDTGVEVGELASDLIDLVIASYGSMSGEELSALTHVEVPWREARGDLPSDALCSTPINPGTMAAFYRAHRMLGGRTASDLAAGGIHVSRAAEVHEAIDIDAIFAAIEEQPDGDEDVWGGANLHPVSAALIEQAAHRAYAGA